METKRHQRVSGWYPIHYELQGDEQTDRLFILLHGYGQNSGDMMTLTSSLPKNSLILAPDGPFPLGRNKMFKHPVNFAWYFYDASSDSFYIDYELPAALLTTLVKDLNLVGIPTTVIGFSQGGYLAPFVGKMMKNVDHVVNISGRFRYERLSQIDFRIDGIHGKNDSIVDPARARTSHEELIKRGAEGEFHLLDGGHEMNDTMKDCLKSVVIYDRSR